MISLEEITHDSCFKFSGEKCASLIQSEVGLVLNITPFLGKPAMPVNYITCAFQEDS